MRSFPCDKNAGIFAEGSIGIVRPLVLRGLSRPDVAAVRAQASKTKMITQQPVMKMTTPIPENRTTPDNVKTSIGTLEFFDGVPIGNTKEMLYDFVDRGRAVEVFINMTPAASIWICDQLTLFRTNQFQDCAYRHPPIFDPPPGPALVGHPQKLRG